MLRVTTRYGYGYTRYLTTTLSGPEFVERGVAIRDVESFGPLQVGLMSPVLEVLLYFTSSPPLSRPICLCPLTEPR